MDAFDRHILRILQQDGRISNQQLADEVGLSTAACWRRVKALEDKHVIRKYAALVDADAVQQGLCVLVMVSLLRHSVDHTKAFEEAMKGCEEVLQCYAVTGNADFMLRVMLPDIKAYDQFLNEKVFPLEGISQVHSNFSLREIKCETALKV
jgi:Lrp/AsnC family leucine-responsive transcriptional regulator